MIKANYYYYANNLFFSTSVKACQFQVSCCCCVPNNVPTEPQRNISIAAVRGPVHPSITVPSFMQNISQFITYKYHINLIIDRYAGLTSKSAFFFSQISMS